MASRGTRPLHIPSQQREYGLGRNAVKLGAPGGRDDLSPYSIRLVWELGWIEANAMLGKVRCWSL